MALPDTYTQVDYIQSTATNPGTTSSSGQVINTGYTHNPNTKIEIEYQYLSTTIQQRMFGSETANSSYSTFVTYINGSGKRARATKDGEGNWQSTEVTADTNRHKFILDKSTYNIYNANGTQIHSGSNAYTITKNGQYPLSIFATRNTSYSGYIKHASAKLYSCKIWDSGTLVRDFVPVIRKSDSKPGLYDLVNDVFYTNAGTGEFTYKKYAESGKIKKILLGTDIIRPKKQVITITYDPTTSDARYSVHKEGYKIISILVEGEANYSSTAWVTQGLVIGHDGDNGFRVYSSIPMGSQRGYDYNNPVSPYGGITGRDNNGFISTGIPELKSSTTTKNNTAITWTLTENSLSYSAGKYFGTWLQSESINLSSNLSSLVKNMFESSSVVIWQYGGATFSKHLFHITYQVL